MVKDTAYSSGFVAIKRQQLLDADAVDRMIHATSLTDTLLVLLDFGYDSSVLYRQPIDVALLLENELKQTVQFFDEFCIDEHLRLACLKKFDYHNAKVFAKAKYTKSLMHNAIYPVGLLGAEFVGQAVQDEDYEQLPKQMAQALLDLDEAENVTGREIDVAIDRAVFDETSHLAKNIKSKLIQKYFQMNADSCNLMTAVRSRVAGLSLTQATSQFVSGGKISTDSLVVLFEAPPITVVREFANSQFCDIVEEICHCLEKSKDFDEVEGKLSQMLLDVADEGVLNTFSDEPLFAWYVQKLSELKVVRLIAICKQNNIDADFIKASLRGVYAE